MAGLEPPDRGSVLVGGEPAASARDWSRLTLLPQRLGLARAGSAVLVASHDPRLVSEADQVVHLAAGRHRHH